jgi:hypothetical protein
LVLDRIQKVWYNRTKIATSKQTPILLAIT